MFKIIKNNFMKFYISNQIFNDFFNMHTPRVQNGKRISKFFGGFLVWHHEYS
jgi:hypothetical protein